MRGAEARSLGALGSEAFSLPVTEKRYSASLPSGAIISVVPTLIANAENKLKERKRRVLSSSTNHELDHYFASSVPLIFITINPSKRRGHEYKAATFLAGFDAVAFAGAYA